MWAIHKTTRAAAVAAWAEKIVSWMGRNGSSWSVCDKTVVGGRSTYSLHQSANKSHAAWPCAWGWLPALLPTFCGVRGVVAVTDESVGGKSGYVVLFLQYLNEKLSAPIFFGCKNCKSKLFNLLILYFLLLPLYHTICICICVLGHFCAITGGLSIDCGSYWLCRFTFRAYTQWNVRSAEHNKSSNSQ